VPRRDPTGTQVDHYARQAGRPTSPYELSRIGARAQYGFPPRSLARCRDGLSAVRAPMEYRSCWRDRLRSRKRRPAPVADRVALEGRGSRGEPILLQHPRVAPRDESGPRYDRRSDTASRWYQRRTGCWNFIRP
jgi:hypothetical protein